METSINSISYFRPAAASATRHGGLELSQSADSDEKVAVANKIDSEKVARGVRMILEGLGDDPDREGLLDTPARVARMYQELVYGVNVDPASEITCTFTEDTEELVLVKDIPFSSVCEHHMLPFVGNATIAYLPMDGKITGLSKLARVVEVSSRRLQVQERMTTQIADAIENKLKARGVLVLLEAEHLCMSLRGIRKPGSKTLTTAFRGEIKENTALRQEIMTLLARP